jgi:hypothetical protein
MISPVMALRVQDWLETLFPVQGLSTTWLEMPFLEQGLYTISLAMV